MASDGTISGTPNVTGTFTYTVTITDKCGKCGTVNCSVCVTPPPPTCTTTTTFDLTGSSSLNGSAGNVRTFTMNGISVKATAFSRTKSGGAWSTAYLGQYSGGLGVTDGSEDGLNNSHTVDNIGRDNYVLFEFSQPVVLNTVSVGYVVKDSDMTIKIGTFTDPYNNHLTPSDGMLNGMYSEDSLTDSAYPRTANVNGGQVSGNAIVVAGWVTDGSPEDQFNLAALA